MNFFGLNLHTNRTLRLLAIGLTLSFSSLSIVAHANSDIKVNGLKPDTRESVRSTGQALLHAKRSYKDDQNTSALRDSIKQTRQLVNELTQPIMTQQIQLTKPGQATQNTANARSTGLPTSWHRAQASKITQLRAAAGNLRSQCQTIRGAKSAEVSPSILDSVVSFFTGKVNLNNSSKHIFTPVTDSAVTYLEKVDSEIETALALPAAQRQQRLHKLAEELNIVAQPIRTDDKKIITPTLSSRTQHRRSW